MSPPRELVEHQVGGRSAPVRTPGPGGWTSRIDELIAELQRLRAGLTGCIGCGCLSLDRCQLANPGDRA
ncbi:MAG: redox-sensitive transcriptional activator SoxR, partial [Bryobacterales bacterium]|nr:redox-sensitive transcriptional activator SoxR [Bryobacterales bacterium]